MKTEKRLTMALSVLVALMMLAVPLASSSNLFVDGGQTNSNGDAPLIGAESSNDDITIKDVYIVKTADELKALPIYESWVKSNNGTYKDIASTAGGYYPCLVTVYNVNDKYSDKTDGYKVKFTLDSYNGFETGKKYTGGFSTMSDYMTNGKDHYYIVSLGTQKFDSDMLSIQDAKNYYNQTYKVTAQVFKSDEISSIGDSVSMDTKADNVIVEEVWIIDSQEGINHVTDYGKKVEDYLGEGVTKWDKNSKPWIAVAFMTSTPGSVTLDIKYGDGSSNFTYYASEANTPYVLTAWLNGTYPNEDVLTDNTTPNDKKYVVSATGASGNISSNSVVYGNISSTYDVIFKLNADETSLDLTEVIKKLPSDVTSSNPTVSGWKVNADGDLVVSVTTEEKKVSIEYLISQIYDIFNRDGYDLIEWSSENGDYTNMSYVDDDEYDSVQYAEGDKEVDKNMTFTAIWELKEGWVEAPVHVYQDDVLVGDFIKSYDIREKNTIFVEVSGLVSDIKKSTELNTYGIIVNDAAKSSAADVREVYSSKVTYGSDNDLPANSKIASNSELTVNYNLNDRLYSKVVIHSEAFKDGEDVTLFALKNKDYTYANVYYALQKESEKTHGIKAALELKNGGDLDKDKNATTSDNYYLLTGWNDGAELLDSGRNAPSELTLDTKLAGYNVVFMVNGQFEVVYIPFGELSADKCTIASGVKYWSYMKYADYNGTITDGKIKTFSFTKSQIDVIEGIDKNPKDSSEPVAVFVGSAYSFNNTAYAVFDASANDGNFGDKYVDKMIVSGKASSGTTTTKTTIPLPEVSPVYENTVVLVGYDGYTASTDKASAFGSAGHVDKFTANVVEYKYTITFYNGSDINGIFYYSDVSTMDSKDITLGLVAFSYKGTAYQIGDTSDDAKKAYNNVLFPAKDGYKVTQWKDSDGNVMLDKVKKETKEESNKNVTTITYEVKFKKVSSDMSFYANFEAQKFGIVYSGNTATATNNMVQVGSVDEALTLFKDSTFSNDGYKLTGWNTRPDGDGTSYKLGDSYTLNGAEFKDLSSIKGMSNVPADIEYGFTLYAIWEKVGASDNPSDNTDGGNDNTALYLIAGMLAVIAILAIVGIVLMRRK